LENTYTVGRVTYFVTEIINFKTSFCNCLRGESPKDYNGIFKLSIFV